MSESVVLFLLPLYADQREKSLEHWTQCQVLRSISPAASDTCSPKYREELEKKDIDT
jgi:hypothetical protein